MRVIIQRVTRCSVTIETDCVASIENGLCLLVGFCEGDDEDTLRKLCNKIVQLRIFEDKEGKMNHDIQSIGGSILSISQFTVYADCKKGNRPSFAKAAKSEQAKRLYDQFNALLGTRVECVKTGVFGVDMKVDIRNDGPVTVILDSEEM